jgi:hypothetical protein
MLKSLLHYIVPFALTLMIGGGLRMAAGPERGARASGVAVVIGFLAAWGVFLAPGWMPGDDFTRIGHIAFGAALVGVVLDLLAPKRFVAAIAAAVVVLVSAWASVTGSLRPHGPLDLTTTVAVVALAIGAFLILVRLDAARERGSAPLVLLLIAALGLAAMAALVGDHRLAVTGMMLAAALIAFALLQWLLHLPVGDALILGAGGVVLAMAWTLGHVHADARLGLLLVPLILFAEGTAARVPLPKARISAVLGPVVLAGVAALPLILAIIVVYVMVNA